MTNYKFIVQYGGTRLDSPGYHPHSKSFQMIRWPDGVEPADIPRIFFTGMALDEIRRADNLKDYQVIFLTYPGDPHKVTRIKGVEVITGNNGHWLIEGRDGRIYGTWTGYDERMPAKYQVDPWPDVIERHRTRTLQPKSYRPLSAKGLFGLIDMIQYIESVSERPLSDFMGAEIGTYQGRAADVFATKFRWLYTIDPWERNGREMVHVKAVYDETMSYHGNVVHYRNTSLEGADRIPDNFLDFVYIDACHDYDNAIADIQAWRPKVKTDGFLCGHDYGQSHNGVQRAVDEIFGKPDKVFSDRSWMIQFKGGERVAE
jgi:hypothetical protein